MEKEFEPKRVIPIINVIDEYLNEKETSGVLKTSLVCSRRYELKRFANFCRLHSIEYPSDIHKNIVISYLKYIKVSKSSVIGILYTLSSFMDYLIDEDLMLDNIAAIIEKPKIYQPKTDYLTFQELERIYQSEAQNAPSKVVDRNLLLFSLFTDICLRVSETINLKLNDVRLDSKQVWVTRKRDKVDKIPLNDDLINKFLNWYEIRPQYKGSDLKWVFLSSHGQQLKPRQAHYIVSKALTRAGIIKRKQGTHLFRHSGASLKAQAGENLVMIQYLLGHENLNTTRRYLHFKWDDLKGMVGRSPVISNKEEKRKNTWAMNN